jgi:excinuclease ABC subunit A
VRGGEIVAQGTPEDVAAEARSYTGQYLKPMLRKQKEVA